MRQGLNFDVCGVSAVVGLQSCGEIFGETGVVMEWFVYRLEDVDVVKSQAASSPAVKLKMAFLSVVEASLMGWRAEPKL